MEYKTKKIIWEDNNEPPKNYIWVKSDGNAYEFNHITRQWEKIMSSNGGGGGSGDILDSWPWNGYPKPLGVIFSDNNGVSDVGDWYWNGDFSVPIETTIYDVNNINWNLIQEHHIRGKGLELYLLYDKSLTPVDEHDSYTEAIGYIPTGPLEHPGYTPSDTYFRIGNLNAVATINGNEYGIVYFGE